MSQHFKLHSSSMGSHEIGPWDCWRRAWPGWPNDTPPPLDAPRWVNRGDIVQYERRNTSEYHSQRNGWDAWVLYARIVGNLQYMALSYNICIYECTYSDYIATVVGTNTNDFVVHGFPRVRRQFSQALLPTKVRCRYGGPSYSCYPRKELQRGVLMDAQHVQQQQHNWNSRSPWCFLDLFFPSRNRHEPSSQSLERTAW